MVDSQTSSTDLRLACCVCCRSLRSGRIVRHLQLRPERFLQDRKSTRLNSSHTLSLHDDLPISAARVEVAGGNYELQTEYAIVLRKEYAIVALQWWILRPHLRICGWPVVSAVARYVQAG